MGDTYFFSGQPTLKNKRGTFIYHNIPTIDSLTKVRPHANLKNFHFLFLKKNLNRNSQPSITKNMHNRASVK